MRTLQLDALNRLSFPDNQVLDMQLTENMLVILLNGAWLETTRQGELFNSCYLVLKNWQDLYIRRYDIEEQWSELSMDTTDFLKDICEAEFSEKQVTLRGFGSQSGLWLEYQARGESLILVCYVLPELALAA